MKRTHLHIPRGQFSPRQRALEFIQIGGRYTVIRVRQRGEEIVASARRRSGNRVLFAFPRTYLKCERRYTKDLYPRTRLLRRTRIQNHRRRRKTSATPLPPRPGIGDRNRLSQQPFFCARIRDAAREIVPIGRGQVGSSKRGGSLPTSAFGYVVRSAALRRRSVRSRLLLPAPPLPQTQLRYNSLLRLLLVSYSLSLFLSV